MNAFVDEDLEEGDLVVLDKGVLKDEFEPIPRRTAAVFGGFGMQSDTMGSALMVSYIEDGVSARYDSRDIDVSATRHVWDRIGRNPDYKTDSTDGVPELFEKLEEEFGEVDTA